MPESKRKPGAETSTQPPARTPAGAGRSPKSAPTGTGKLRVPRARHAAERTPRGRTGRSSGNIVIRPFGPQSAVLLRAAVERLARVARLLVHAHRVLCIGYTDSLGARTYNLALGLDRARAVCERLRAFGVRASLESQSRGEQQPLASNATAGGRALNRRVELRVTY